VGAFGSWVVNRRYRRAADAGGEGGRAKFDGRVDRQHQKARRERVVGNRNRVIHFENEFAPFVV
jgi:hypothetical protein